MTARLTPGEGASLLALARAAIEEKLFADGSLSRARASVTVTPAIAARRASFVMLQLRADGGALALRGCVGTTEARFPLHEAVVASAVEAAFEDPRFKPLSHQEYPAVVISVSALTVETPIPSADGIVVGRDGVILEYDGRRALFLPEVAPKYRWSRIELLEQLARKAGLSPDAWRRAELRTFESEHFEESAAGGC